MTGRYNYQYILYTYFIILNIYRRKRSCALKHTHYVGKSQKESLQECNCKQPCTNRALTATEQRYSQIEKEALAMTWACDKFDCYLLGKDQPFQVETDHKPLQTIMNLQDVDQCPPRLQRLKMRMMRYFFEVIYVPGKNLVIACPRRGSGQ